MATTLYYADLPYSVDIYGGNLLETRKSTLKSVVFGTIPLTFSDSCFDGCIGLSSIVIPNYITELPKGCFYGCNGLSSIVIPNSVTTIGTDCFNGCSGLTNIVIPNSVTSIGDNCFYNCHCLTEIVIPNSVNQPLGNNCFQNCYALKNVTLSNSLTSLPLNSFNTCYSLSSISLPDGLIQLGDNCFYSCFALKTINLNKCQIIGNSCFFGCNTLTQLVIPSSVTNIGINFIGNCSALFDVIFVNQNNIDTILNQAFVDINNISNSIREYTTFYFYSTTSLNADMNKAINFANETYNRNIQIKIYENPYIPPTPPESYIIATGNLYEFYTKSAKKKTQKKIRNYIDNI